MTQKSFNSKNSKALLYVRVSSEEQEKDGFSLDAQEKLGREYAKKHNLTIVKFWKVSESAWRNNRKQFQNMIDYAQRHTDVEHIIFDVLDRMTRNDFDKMRITNLIKNHSKIIHFSRTNKILDKDSDSSDVFMFDIEVAVAKKMSEDISRKASMGMQEKASQGFFSGTAPIGYLNNTTTKLIVIDTERAPFIKRAFELKASGNYSNQSLVDLLYREGLRTRRGNPVKKSSISRLLNNHIYYGSFHWKGQLLEGKHEPIISKQLFDSVQKILSSKGNRPMKTKHNFPFQGVARCGECGCTILGEFRKGKYTYYHCGFSKGRHESNKYITSKKMPLLFEDIVAKVAISDELSSWVIDSIAYHQTGEQNYRKERNASLNKEQGKLQKRRSNLYDKLLDNDIDNDMFKDKEQEIKERLATINYELEQINTSGNNAIRHAKKLLELCKGLYDVYLSVDDKKKAQLLRIIGSNYSLVGTTVSVTYNKPFNFLVNLPDSIIKLRWQDLNLRQAD